jgi:hypothetical protein
MKRLSKPKSISIIGYVMALYDNNPSTPVLITIEEEMWFPIYSTVDKLEASMKLIGATNYTIKQITNGSDFLESIGDAVMICADPYIYCGNTRFTLVKLNSKGE